jgi:hypothetical protein
MMPKEEDILVAKIHFVQANLVALVHLGIKPIQPPRYHGPITFFHLFLGYLLTAVQPF